MIEIVFATQAEMDACMTGDGPGLPEPFYAAGFRYRLASDPPGQNRGGGGRADAVRFVRSNPYFDFTGGGGGGEGSTDTVPHNENLLDHGIPEIHEEER